MEATMIRLFIISVFFLLFTNLSAQKNLILRSDGAQFKNYGQLYSSEVLPFNPQKNKKAVRQFYEDNNTLTDCNDILFYQFPIDAGANFGFFGQDWFVQWFEAPADMTINRAGFNVNAVDAEGLTVALKLVTVNWTRPQIVSASETSLGYYPAEGNGFGNATAFFDNPDRTGDWVDLTGNGTAPPFGDDLWSDSGNGINSEAIPSGSVNVYQWTDMSVLGNNPIVPEGSLVGVAVKNNSTTLDGDRVGMLASNALGIPGFKFYASGRSPAGWWIRYYTWDFALDVTITGDAHPDINSYDILPTTLSTADRTVNADISDTNPSGGPAGVATVDLFYSIDGGTTWVTEAMTGTEPNYSAVIPGQPAGTEVTYYLDNITDVQGNAADPTNPVTYTIYKPTPGINTLLVFNGYTSPTGYPQQYYFGFLANVSFDHDVWSYGALTAELLNNYTNVFEIATTGRNTIDNEAIRTWLSADANHNFAVFGDEYIGSQTGWVDSTYTAGDFFFDVLGIMADHNDISFNGVDYPPADGSVVYPQIGTVLGWQLLDKYNQVTTDSGWTAPMLYSPHFEIGVSNWLDGVDFAPDVEVDMTADNFDGSANYAILGHRTLAAGNKIVFGAYDPLSLDSDPTNQIEYYWYGADFIAPQLTTLIWFVIPTDVQQIGNEIPEKFVLSQNYPNPFNPTTTIKYSIPENYRDSDIHRNDSRIIKLKIYDVLGREIKTLVNEKQNPGNYQVQFNASGLPSGVYIYRIEAGNFNQSKKMMLLR